MEDLGATITSALTERFTTLASRVHELAEPLTDDQFWCKPFPFGNSFGHLVLHLTGNLNYYIGTQISRTGYVRDREREFTETQPARKEDTLGSFDKAVAMVVRAIHDQSYPDWLASYSAVGSGDVGSRFHMVLKCAAHLDHHVGQMIYLCFALKRENA
jgi:uncharacterized damage-inducible protein DinB